MISVWLVFCVCAILIHIHEGNTYASMWATAACIHACYVIAITEDNLENDGDTYQ
jgi:hypothetical protein